MRIFLSLLLSMSLCAVAQTTAPDDKQAVAPLAQGPLDYVCPMDKDVRADKPGYCPRCHMKLVLGVPGDSEFPVDLTISPRRFQAGGKVQLTFRVRDPKTGKTVDHFEIVHDKFFHMFVVSQDLGYFLHDHPVPQADGTFVFDAVFPKPGMYRVGADFYPAGGTPQLIARTVIVPGAAGSDLSVAEPHLKPALGVSHCENMDVELAMDPPEPIAGTKTLLFFRIKPADGIEQYLSAWGHMLVASDDLIDLIHDHPFIADGGPRMQFNIIFPRARTYKIWVQFQRKGVVNTASFTVPVSELK